MELEVSRPDPHTGPALTLRDATDCRRLLVRLDGVGVEEAAEALVAAGLGRVQDEHAWLDIARLRQEVRAALEKGDGQPDLAPFDRMIEYARSRGWGSPDGSRVRAHVERQASEPETRNGTRAGRRQDM